MMVITELGDVKRFKSPTNLFSYCGFDIIEYSSGGKEKKYSMSKDGNRFVRDAMIEANQYSLNTPKVSYQLQLRRRGIDKDFRKIADRCMRRLHKKGTRLLYAGKHRNKVKVACAREMLGFVWESLILAS